MRISIQRIILSMSSLLLLGGCASDCNILSSSNSLGCDVALGTGLILAAPIGVPVALLSDAASNARAKRMAREWQGTMQTRLAEGDADAIRECLADCLDAWKYELDYRERRALSQEAAERYLAGSDSSGNRHEHDAYRALAHSILAWRPESEEEDAPFQMHAEHSRQAYVLLKDEAIRKQLESSLERRRYSDVVRGVYAQVYAASMPDEDAAAQKRYGQCVSDVQKIMYEDESDSYRYWTCSSSYYYRFRQRVPDDLLRPARG